MATEPEDVADAAPEPSALPPLRRYRIPWPELLKKVFDVDVLACPECGGRLRVIAFFAKAKVAERILDHLGLASTGPPPTPARRVPDLVEPAPDYDQPDATYDT